MRKARYYIYRNLHKPGCFSVKHRGKVILTSKDILAFDVEFRVSEAGRKRVIEEKRKNVHAYAVTDRFYTYQDDISNSVFEQYVSGKKKKEITYNPYTMNSFSWNEDKKKIKGLVDTVLLSNNKVYSIG